MISWGLIMDVASYPVSGLPLALRLWPTANRIHLTLVGLTTLGQPRA